MLPFFLAQGAVAKRLCTGLQIRVGRFDSGPRLHHFSPEINKTAPKGAFCCVRYGDLSQLRHLGSMSMKPVHAMDHHPATVGQSKGRRRNDIQ